MPRLLLSSGRGPFECELAVGLYCRHVLAQHPSARILREVRSKTATIHGKRLTGYSSVLLELPDGAPLRTGSVRWVCPSPVRSNHRRKNWFIVVSQVTEDDAASPRDDGGLETAMPEQRECRVDTFRCPGKGGQNVNKVETGVRVTHLPTGIVAESVTARTQLGNRKLAFARLREKIMASHAARADQLQKEAWTTHDQIERGNAFATFVGLDFVLADD